jgi:glycosyltransferase involved in cell wall biosynthesis
MSVSIVYMITGLSTGGSETALARLLARLNRDRFRPTVVCLKDGETPIGAEIRSLDTPVLDLHLVHPARIGALWHLYSLLRETRPSIVHAWLFHAVVLGRLVGRMARVPIVISSRQNINLGSPVREIVNRMTIGIDDQVIAVSEAARRVDIERGGAKPEKVVVIYNGVDLCDYPPLTPDMRAEARSALGFPLGTKLVGTVARLHPSKGIDDLIKAAARVLARVPDTRFLVVGDGKQRAALKRLTDELGLAERVLFLGERHDVPFLLAGLDLFVLSSREEGMGIALLEAMASGIPVVATAVGGVVEAVEDTVSGLLVPRGDVDRLAESIISMLNTPELAAEMAKNGRRRVEAMFSIDTTVERTEQVYEELLERKLGLRQVDGRGWKKT